MFGLREAGVLGASVAVAGGVAYLIWTYASSPGQKEPEPRPGGDGKSAVEEAKRVVEEGREEEEEEEVVVRREEAPIQQTVAAATEAQKTSKPQPAESEGTQVLVLGLDGAGKTSLLHCFATGSPDQDMQPTQGFNAVSVNRDDLHIEFLEIGGKEELRPYWQRYVSKALLLVFVVDASEPQRFPVAKEHLHGLLSPRPGLPLMVLANKQDLPGSCGITELHDALCLSDVGDRQLFLIGTHTKLSDAGLSSGLQDAQDLIIQIACGER